jgi:hypothetical protein
MLSMKQFALALTGFVTLALPSACSPRLQWNLMPICSDRDAIVKSMSP